MRYLALLVSLLLVGCATTPAPEKRYDAPELLALQPSALTWRATSQQGERELREAELATLRARIALLAGPERDAACRRSSKPSPSSTPRSMPAAPCCWPLCRAWPRGTPTPSAPCSRQRTASTPARPRR